MLRKSGRYRGTWFLVSRSFDSQQSWKEASTQEGAKGAATKNLGRENLQKNLEPNPQEHSSIQRKPRPEMAKKWLTVLPRSCSQTELVYKVLQRDTPNRLNSNRADYSSTKRSYTYIDHCLFLCIPCIFWSKDHLLYKYIRINYILLASYNLSLKG